MTKFSYYFVINLLVLGVIDARLFHLRSLDRYNLEPASSDSKAFKRSLHRLEKRSQTHRTKKYVNNPLKFSDEKFPPQDLVANCNDEIYARFVRWKGDMRAEKCKAKEKLNTRFRGRRKKESSRRPRRRYVDYTNSQMPFNEGVKGIQNPPLLGPSKLQMEKSVAERKYEHLPKKLDDAVDYARARRFLDRKSVRKRLTLESLEEELPDNYSRVRRFLDQERAKKRVRASATLEAKEAAMSGVLDPNLNLDGILEPHVRKRRDEHLGLSFRCDFVAPKECDQARDYDQSELLTHDFRNRF